MPASDSPPIPSGESKTRRGIPRTSYKRKKYPAWTIGDDPIIDRDRHAQSATGNKRKRQRGERRGLDAPEDNDNRAIHVTVTDRLYRSDMYVLTRDPSRTDAASRAQAVPLSFSPLSLCLVASHRRLSCCVSQN